ncbi:DUF4123 domain-containing protein [Vreelandella olivaria]|uniref:DUF4123 domain-containing protein n=1 Tax=Vreelandella olivaria TaxID=390919 RepID=UPI00201F762A
MLDEKCLTGGFSHINTLPGILASTGLFKGTPLYFIANSEPLLLDVEIGSRAWQTAMQLCLCQAGWVCEPTADVSFEAVAHHLRVLCVLDDSDGGRSFVRLQHPHVWLTLLASAEPAVLKHWLGPLGQVAIPCVQGGWFRWTTPEEEESILNPWQLTQEMDKALQLSRPKSSTQPPTDWLIRMR